MTKADLPINQILQGDCREVLAKFPAESIDMVMFSPPYYGLRDYSELAETIWGGKKDCEHEWTRGPTLRKHGDFMPDCKQATVRGFLTSFQAGNICVKCGAYKGQLGLEPSWRMYVNHLVEVCREIKRVLKKTGSIYIVLGDTYASSGGPTRHWGCTDPKYPEGRKVTYIEPQSLKQDPYKPKCLMGIPWRVAFALIDDGWILRNAIVWHKPNAMPSSVKDRLSQTYEFIFHFVKQRKYYYDLDAIREPHSIATLKRIFQPTVMQQQGGPKQAEYRRMKKKLGGADLKVHADIVKRLAKKYRSKYEGSSYGQTLQGFIRSQSIAKQRALSRIIAKQLFPNDPKKQQEYINYIHDHAGHPLGKNPRNVIFIKHDLAVNRVGNFSYTDPLHVKAYHPKGKNPSDFWFIPTKPFKDAHFSVYPLEICIRPIISSSPPNGIVLDPMCGSGTTCLAAHILGRKWIGIDINPTYVELAKRRLRFEYAEHLIEKEKGGKVGFKRQRFQCPKCNRTVSLVKGMLNPKPKCPCCEVQLVSL